MGVSSYSYLNGAVFQNTSDWGTYVGKVQTMYFRLQATKTAGLCVSYSTPVAVHKLNLIDP